MIRIRHLGRRFGGFALILQVVPVCGGLLFAETQLGAGDALLLVPVTDAARRALPARALDGRSRLLGAGLLPGSLVVAFDGRHRPPVWRDGVLALRVARHLCGGAAA